MLPSLLIMLLLFVPCMASTGAIPPKKMEQDQLLVPQEPDVGIKCGSCPCVNPCTQVQSPPPPPPPPPQPKTTYCPPLPPPPPRFVYVTTAPGTVYETDPYDWEFYNGAGHIVVSWLLVVLIGLGVLSLSV